MAKFSLRGHNTKWRKIFDLTLSVGLGLFLAAMVFLWWSDYQRQEHDATRQKVQLTGHFISTQFRETLEYNTRTLLNLKRRIEITNGDYFNFWAYDAQLILEQNPSFVFIEWIDSNMVIQRVQPMEGNEEAIGLDLRTIDYRRKKWLESVQENSINITKWATLAQGGEAFLVDAPVHYNNRFQGTITAGMDFTTHFNNIMSGREMYSLRVMDHTGTVFYESGKMDDENGDAKPFVATIPINKAGNRLWTFVLQPNTVFYENHPFSTSRFGLLAGLLMAAIIGVAFFFMRKSSRESQQVKLINSRLQSMNMALEEQKRKAEEASRTKSEFLSNMSHEIRTPLNAILGFIGIMKVEESDEVQRQKYLDMMEQSSKNLLALVNDVLELHRGEASGAALRLKPFSPVREVREVLDLYEGDFRQKGIYLKRQLPANEEKRVHGDPVKFGQVVTNLIRNAFKFTEKGGVEVSLDLHTEGLVVYLKLSIRDTGIGIPPESLEHIFKRFYQVEAGFKRKYEGTGLGLAITKEIVETLGGRISAESELGEGSEFKVHLSFPLVKEYGKNKNYSAGRRNGKHPRRVLIAEDNPLNVMILSKSLEDFNLKVEAVGSGTEVLEAVRDKKYDLIFMDVHMPGMDGIEATRNLRKKGIGIPIVAISANVTNDAVQKAMNAGMQDYVTKPFTRQVLKEIVDKYLPAEDHKNQ